MLQLCFHIVESLIRELFQIMAYKNYSRRVIMLRNRNKIILVKLEHNDINLIFQYLYFKS